MPRTVLRQVGYEPAADALRLLLRCGESLPAAGIGLSSTENTFVWLARLMCDAATSPRAGDHGPEAVRQRLAGRIERLFSGEAAQFPLLTGTRSTDSDDAGPGPFQDAARQLRTLDLTGADFDILGELYGAYVERGRFSPQGQHFTPGSVAKLMVDRAVRAGVGGRLYDPAMGTGQFLVPYLSKLRTEGASAHDLVTSISGSELSRVSHCLAQANLVLKVAAMRPRTPLPAPDLRLENSLWNLGEAGSARYDICCANPPYLGERTHKAVFDRLRREIPSLAVRKAPHTDLFYYFAELALEVTRPGGVIALLTTAYWLTADGAAELRENLDAKAALLELVDFGEQRIFHSAGGQHNLLVLLRKRGGRRAAEQPLTWARVRRPAPLPELCEAASACLDEARTRGGAVETERISAGVGQLVRPSGARGVWHVPAGRRREEVLEAIAGMGTRLGDVARVSQGLISGADRVTETNYRRLAWGRPVELGTGIFVLTPQELEWAGIPLDCAVVRPFYKNSQIERYGAIPDRPRRYVLYLDGSLSIDSLKPVQRHLLRYRPILEQRREVRAGRIPWWRLHWPRRESLFTGPKLACPHRAASNTFELSDSPFFASADVYFVSGLDSRDHLNLLLGVLNSAVLDFWFAHRGKRKGEQREYYATPLREVPVPPLVEWPDDEVASLTERAAIDESLPDRVAWSVARGDLASADRPIARVASELRGVRRRMTGDDLREIALGIIEERRLEMILGQIVAARYGMTGDRAWMYELVLESVHGG